MNDQTILDSLRHQLENPNLVRSDTLNDLGLDSLDTLDLLVSVADETGIDYTFAKVASLETLGDVIRLFQPDAEVAQIDHL